MTATCTVNIAQFEDGLRYAARLGSNERPYPWSYHHGPFETLEDLREHYQSSVNGAVVREIHRALTVDGARLSPPNTFKVPSRASWFARVLGASEYLVDESGGMWSTDISDWSFASHTGSVELSSVFDDPRRELALDPQALTGLRLEGAEIRVPAGSQLPFTTLRPSQVREVDWYVDSEQKEIEPPAAVHEASQAPRHPVGDLELQRTGELLEMVSRLRDSARPALCNTYLVRNLNSAAINEQLGPLIPRYLAISDPYNRMSNTYPLKDTARLLLEEAAHVALQVKWDVDLDEGRAKQVVRQLLETYRLEAEDPYDDEEWRKQLATRRWRVARDYVSCAMNEEPKNEERA